MTAILSLLTGPNGILMALGAIVAVVFGAFMKGRVSGAAKERAKAALDKAESARAAAEERMEMNREATAFEREAAGMTDEELDRRITR